MSAFVATIDLTSSSLSTTSSTARSDYRHAVLAGAADSWMRPVGATHMMVVSIGWSLSKTL
jgi:hypothetical protein